MIRKMMSLKKHGRINVIGELRCVFIFAFFEVDYKCNAANCNNFFVPQKFSISEVANAVASDYGKVKSLWNVY